MKRIYGGMLLIMLMLMVTGCLFPDNSTLMELNRKGKWEQAVETGGEMYRNRSTFTPEKRAETLYHTMYALMRLEKTGEARQVLMEYDKLIREDLPGEELTWVSGEMNKLRILIEEGDPFPRGRELRELNRRGDWAEAEKKGSALLEQKPTLSPEEYAETLYYLTYARVRLGKTEEALENITVWEQFTNCYPPKSGIVLAQGGNGKT